jgi:TetR/AcrR family transcriptional regulator
MDMSEPGRSRGEKTREALLNAAETVFAEHGYDGARIDTIAEVSGFNKTLIFRYFGDKPGLYAEVLRRVDREINELQARLAPMLEDETIASDAQRFRTFLATGIGALFDYLLEHPRFMRMLTWEMAEGWQTYAKIAQLLKIDDIDQSGTLLQPLQSAGLLRSGFNPILQLTMIMQICQAYLASLPLYQMILPGEDISSATALARAREYIIDFVIHGIMVDPQRNQGEENHKHTKAKNDETA